MRNRVPHLYFLLAYKRAHTFCLHHPAPGSNVIMQELKKKNVKILSEKVLLLLNRGGKNATFVAYISRSASLLSAHWGHDTFFFCPVLSRRPRVYVQTQPARTTLCAQVSAGCFRQPRDQRHLLPHRHDGDDRHRRSTNIWPFTWRQGETQTHINILTFSENALSCLHNDYETCSGRFIYSAQGQENWIWWYKICLLTPLKLNV